MTSAAGAATRQLSARWNGRRGLPVTAGSCRLRRITLLLAVLPLACGGDGRPSDASGRPGDASGRPGDASGRSGDASGRSGSADAGPQQAFLANLGAHCGQAFPGRLALTPEGDTMLTGTEDLLVHFRDCEPDEVRIPFHMEVAATGQWNRSRTWYVMAADQGLELRHDHREPDGAESTRTWYGGFTRTGGSATRQDFLSPERTAAAGVPVGWRIEIDPGAHYRYGTTYDGEYDWMIEFDLSRAVDGEIPAAWGAQNPPSRVPGPP
jgi:hypothetical protein